MSSLVQKGDNIFNSANMTGLALKIQRFKDKGKSYIGHLFFSFSFIFLRTN